MDITEYEQITGTVVNDADIEKVEAIIKKTQIMLEDMLGYTLDEDKVDENYYNELGKTKSDVCCPSEINTNNLDEPDEVVSAYRVFDYNNKDKFWLIDPAEKINKVKLIVGNVTVKTLEEYKDYNIYSKNGVIKYLEKIDCCYRCCEMKNVQLAVDAEWEFTSGIPDDLNYLWADMVTFYRSNKNDIKSESLGPHSYTKFDNDPPEKITSNSLIIQKYAGANGSVNKLITL